MASVLDLVKHYQRGIERYRNDEQRILKAIDKLYSLDVKTHHLQETGVGRTVNALRKEPGDVGKAARALVYKWKLMVASEESDQEDDYERPMQNGHGSSKESDTDRQESQRRSNSKQNGDSGPKRKYQSSEESEPDPKKSRQSYSSDSDNYRNRKIKTECRTESEESDSESESDSETSEEERKEIKIEPEDKVLIQNIKTEPEDKYSSRNTTNNCKPEPSGSRRSHGSEDNSSKTSKKHSESYSEKSLSSSQSPNKKSSKERDEKSDKKYKENSEKEHSRIKEDKSMREKEEYMRKEKDAKAIKEKIEKEQQESSKKSDKHTSSNKESTSDKHKSHDKSKSDVDKHKSDKHSSKSDKEKHKSDKEKSDKHRSSESSSKEKGSSSKEKSKDSKSSYSKEKDKSSSSHSSKSDKKHSSSDKSRSDKHKSERSEVKISEKRSSHKSSSSEKSKSSDRSKEDKPKKKVTIQENNEETDEEGIGCESGASFAEALGMIIPSKPKKKQFTPTKNPTSPINPVTNDLSPAAMLAPTAKLAPLPALEISALPEISPNYKPRPPPKFQPHFTDEDAMCMSISSKNQRTKVYSGNKTLGKVPTLYEMCVQILQEHIDALEYTGGVPYEILKPVVDKATPQQLFVLEHYNPYLMEDTDHLWQKHCEKHFRNKKRQELETWREMYMRCQEEQEHKLKSLTENIRMTQEAKKAPIKQTKMAYVDSVVKPPRNIARKQAQHGTAHMATASPAARVAALAAAPNVLRGGVRAPPAAPVSAAAFNKPKKAPLMQKALQFMRGRKR